MQLITLTFWVTLLCTGVFAQNWVRRRNYEVFYYMHHVYLALFIATLMHSSSAWYHHHPLPDPSSSPETLNSDRHRQTPPNRFLPETSMLDPGPTPTRP